MTAVMWKLYEPVHGLWVGKNGFFVANEKDAKKMSYQEAWNIQYYSDVALVFRRVENGT